METCQDCGLRLDLCCCAIEAEMAEEADRAVEALLERRMRERRVTALDFHAGEEH